MRSSSPARGRQTAGVFDRAVEQVGSLESAPGVRKRQGAGALTRSKQGLVLLEVVLALVLFVGAAAVIAGAINASLEGVQRQKLTTHAVNLAVSVLSELQIGLRSPAAAGPEPFLAPFEHWTWQLVLTAKEAQLNSSAGGLTLVEVIIRHDDPPLVYRQAQALKLEKPPGPVAAAGGAF